LVTVEVLLVVVEAVEDKVEVVAVVVELAAVQKAMPWMCICLEVDPWLNKRRKWLSQYPIRFKYETLYESIFDLNFHCI
jgi:hypothetical protein